MFNKALKKRLKSLEEFFGLKYIQPEGEYDGDYHLHEDIGSMPYSFMADLKKLIKNYREKEEAKTKK